MDLETVLALARRNWIFLLAAGLIGVALGAAATLTTTPQYEATSQVFVSTTSASSVTDLSQGGIYAQQAVKSYAQVATTPLVLDRVRDSLRLGETSAQLAEEVTATVPPDTVVIQITATDVSAIRAARIANSVSRYLSETVETLSPSSDSESEVKITELAAAVPPTEPATPNLRVNLALGILLSLGAGSLVLLAREVLDTRIRKSGDVERLDGGAILGTVPYASEISQSPLLFRHSASGGFAESIRVLRTNLHFIRASSKSRQFLVTSSIPSEGKSTTTANLALAIADAGFSVLLIDADLRRPKIAEAFGLDGTLGLTDFLVGSSELENHVQVMSDYLHILPAGTLPPNPSELLQSDAMRALLETTSDRYDYVLIDAPPLLPVADAVVLAPMVARVIVVVALNRTRRGQMAAAIASLKRVDASMAGFVATMARSVHQEGYEYGYGNTVISAEPRLPSADSVPKSGPE